MSDSVVPTPSEKCEHGWTFRHSFVVQFANGIHYTTETRSCPGPVITTRAAEIAEAKLAIPDDVRSALEWCSARENPDQFSDFDEVIVRDWLASHPKDSA